MNMNTLTISKRDGFQTIDMAWSAQHPGFRIATFEEATHAIRNADDDPEVACNIFFGVPRCFCLGTDASSFGESNNLTDLSDGALKFFSALINAKKPLIAAVDGNAIGLGMTMLFHFDVVFATPESIFKAPFAEWGLCPEASSSILFPETLGYRTAFDIFCLGTALTAVEAEQRGLVSRVIPATELAATALDAAKSLAKLPQRPLRATRELMRQQRTRLIKQSRAENDVFRELLGDMTTQRRLKAMARATRMALADRKREFATT